MSRHTNFMQDCIGEKHGRLTFLGLAGKSPSGRMLASCLCSCGRMKRLRVDHLFDKTTKSCGCIRPGHTKTKTYDCWINLKERCLNPKNGAYHRYGGRGITVCDHWKYSFENFLKDMGHMPEGLTIERINNNGNYEPSNCKWATWSEQAFNRNPKGYTGTKR